MKTSSIFLFLLVAAPFLMAQQPAAIPQSSAATAPTKPLPEQVQAFASVSESLSMQAGLYCAPIVAMYNIYLGLEKEQ